MKNLIEEIISLQVAENAYYSEDLSTPEPGPPATEAALARLDAFLRDKGLETPPSLREALAAHDGVTHLYGPDFGLLSVEDIVTGRVEPEEEVVEEYPNATDIIIGGGNSAYVMGLDRDAVGPGGEVGVLVVMPDGADDRSASLRAYMEEIRDAVRARLEAERRDRDQLPDN